MKWMRERDLLIAQTMAFVQSVTGKKPDTDQFTAASETKGPVIAEAPMTNIEAVLAETAQPPRPAQPIQAARPDFPDDFRSEVKARIANFRAHQERFLKEREAYCSATMAKVRAALGETEPPRFGK
ncbi:MAG: hypothetical protein ACJ8EE_04030 [Bradyrhizobium sp.]